MQVAKRKLILQAVGDDNTSQIAQLLALEYLVGVTAPHRLGEVGVQLGSTGACLADALSVAALRCCWCTLCAPPGKAGKMALQHWPCCVKC